MPRSMTAKAFLETHRSATTLECIEWPFYRTATGYGYCRIGSETGTAHRFMCLMAHGAPGFKSAEAAHSCGNRACVNPNHLRWATSKENHADRVAHGTTNKGQKHPLNKLSENDVRAIRNRGAAGDSHRQIARDYGISKTTVRHIVIRRIWSWLP